MRARSVGARAGSWASRDFPGIQSAGASLYAGAGLGRLLYGAGAGLGRSLYVRVLVSVDGVYCSSLLPVCDLCFHFLFMVNFDQGKLKIYYF